MTRILGVALLVAALAAALLFQLDRGQELWMWELLLFVTVVWLARGLPDGGNGTAGRLFAGNASIPTRLPRSVSAAEMAAVDALVGGPRREQRIRPILERIAVHRLQRHGIDLGSAEAMASLGEEPWRWLTGREGKLRPGDLDHLVAALERL